MNSRLDAFRDFISRYPKVHDDVLTGKKTWQTIYEDWVLLGESHPQWQPYMDVDMIKSKATSGIQNFFDTSGLKNAVGYIKKINPDSVTRTLNTVQKVLQVTQSFGGKKGIYNANFNSWWD